MSTPPQPPRTLRQRDLVLFLIVAVVSPRWIATAAAAGPSALVVWLIGLVAFFLPLALTVIELSSRDPSEGGLYAWSRRAFGDFAGFLTGWMYWASNLVYFPGLLYFMAGNLLLIGGGRWSGLANHPLYYVLASLAGLAIALALNLVGLRVGKWLHNLGAIGGWGPIALLVVIGLVVGMRSGSATPLAAAAWLPGTRLDDLVFWSTIAFAFSGLEAAAFLGGEVVDARRTLPRAFIVGGIAIVATYVLGTLALMVLMPAREIGGLEDLAAAIESGGRSLGVPGLGRISAIALVVGSLGGVGAWLASVARLPFAAGMDRLLPPAFGRPHPRWGTPYVALLVQGIGAALFVLLGQAGTTVRGAYDALVGMTVIVYFVPYLVMFACLIRAQREPAAAGVRRVPGGPLGATLVALVGAGATLAAMVLAAVPPKDSPNPAWAVAKILLGCGSLALAGVLLYRRGRRRQTPDELDSPGR